MYQKSAKYGILPACVGKPWPRQYTSAPEPAGYDYFHELINVDEGSRCGGGIAWAMMGGLGIGMPPILNFCIWATPPFRSASSASACLARRSSACASPSPAREARVQSRHHRQGHGRSLLSRRKQKMDHERHLRRLFHRRRAHGPAWERSTRAYPCSSLEKTMSSASPCPRWTAWASGSAARPTSSSTTSVCPRPTSWVRSARVSNR